MRQAKRDTLWKEIETEGKWQKKHETHRFYRREKQGDTQEEKRKKNTKKKRPNKKKSKNNEQK